jgi:hypothetical protein
MLKQKLIIFVVGRRSCCCLTLGTLSLFKENAMQLLKCFKLRARTRAQNNLENLKSLTFAVIIKSGVHVV